jgi:hypothetical protein
MALTGRFPRGRREAAGQSAAGMTEPHVVAALRAKRAEIAGDIAELEHRLRQERMSLAHIDATLRLFAPDLNPATIPAKRHYRRTRYFAKGELARTVLDVLRKAHGEPLTATDIVIGVIEARGFPNDDSLVASTRRMALGVLRRFAKRGTALKSGTSRNTEWALIGKLKPGASDIGLGKRLVWEIAR